VTTADLWLRRAAGVAVLLPAADGADVLTLSGVSAGYGATMAVTDLSLVVGVGEAVGLLGANGAGKSTTLRAVSGLLRLRSGTITFEGTNIGALPPYKIAELGIAHVPEGRQVFPEMTVQENLEIGAYIPRAKAERRRSLDLVYAIFPALAERRRQVAGTMSGGEQQMLAIGRGLMLKPRFLMLDEPSLGLAPVMADTTFNAIERIHAMGMAILLVEQNAIRALALVRRAYVLESGRVVMHGTSAELVNNAQVRSAYLGVAAPNGPVDRPMRRR
jgi:branched-chain amino acid transport system ATP-binding protein